MTTFLGALLVLTLLVTFSTAQNGTEPAYLKASNTDPQDLFGKAVAIDGDTIVVAATYESSSAIGVNGDQLDNGAARAGAAYVFVRNGMTWSQQAYLKASNTDPYDEFGSTVAISGDTIVIGAFRESSNANGVSGAASNSGAAYVFVRTGTTWSQQALLKASNVGNIDWFGYAVAIDGDTIVVGSFGESSAATGVNGDQANNDATGSGAVYIFARTGTTWTQQSYIKASNTDAGDRFGSSVAIYSNTVVVGASRESSAATGVNGNQQSNTAADAGAAYVFTRNDTTWSQQAYLKASNTDAGDWFGLSVAVYGDTIVVGASQEASSATGINGNQQSNAASRAGAAYVFTRSGTTWTQQSYLKATNTLTDSWFGYPAIFGSTILVGAPLEDFGATGINGQTTGQLPDSGAAYLFEGTSITYIKAPNAGAGDTFGVSVAFSGNTTVICAAGESSDATGVDGDQFNNLAANSGACYVYDVYSILNTEGSTSGASTDTTSGASIDTTSGTNSSTDSEASGSSSSSVGFIFSVTLLLALFQ